jgi:hypothetical protein
MQKCPPIFHFEIITNDCSNFEKSLECSFVDSFSEGINILCLNCCGLKRRLNYPEFESLIKHCGIMCFSETKTDDVDNIELDGYEFK